MRVLVIYAHPLEDSLNGVLFDSVKESLSEAGHEVDGLDLYAENFDPVLSADERRDYFDVEKNRSRTAEYVARIEAAQGLVFVFPGDPGRAEECAFPAIPSAADPAC